ncbi:MAG: carboxypeptidase regulatory-like domain-containing protein [Vicinamibacteria bacterium]|nr:carboxypeptidase regulatory-like domain-containing protein [Vicinamibacteria bacterium]
MESRKLIWGIAAALALSSAPTAGSGANEASVTLIGPAAGRGIRLTVGARSLSCRQTPSIQTTTNRAQLTLPCAGSWKVSCSGPGVFCSNAYITTGGSQPVGATVAVYESTLVTGQVRTRDVSASALPLSIHGRIHSAGGSEFVVDTRAQGGEFQAALPKIESDVRVSSPGYVPIYVWNTSTFVELKSLRLVPGASVSGTLIRPESGPRLDGAAMFLVSADTAASGSLSLSEAVARVDKSGFFQFADVAPGEYDLEVRAPQAPSMAAGRVLVRAETETYLGNVIPQPPIVASFAITPPGDPDGRAWRVDLTGTTARQRARSGRVGPDGLIQFQDFSPGTYKMQVMSSKGSRVFSARQDVGPEQIPINLRMVQLNGRVSFGKEKLAAATIELMTGRGDTSTYTSDDDGRFSGMLRRPEWKALTAQIRAPQSGVSRRLLIKDFSLSESNLDLDIVIPDATIRGRVVDSAGIPRADVPVRLVGGDGFEEHSGRSNPLGEFEFRGVGDGTFVAAAGRQDTAPSRQVTVRVASGEPDTKAVVLTLPAALPLRVHVGSEAGRPVTGTSIWVWPAGHAMPAGGSGLPLPPNGTATVQFPSGTSIGALIAGKVAAKAGLLKVLLGLLIAGKKFVVVALAAAGLKRLFGPKQRAE